MLTLATRWAQMPVRPQPRPTRRHRAAAPPPRNLRVVLHRSPGAASGRPLPQPCRNNPLSAATADSGPHSRRRNWGGGDRLLFHHRVRPCVVVGVPHDGAGDFEACAGGGGDEDRGRKVSTGHAISSPVPVRALRPLLPLAVAPLAAASDASTPATRRRGWSQRGGPRARAAARGCSAPVCAFAALRRQAATRSRAPGAPVGTATGGRQCPHTRCWRLRGGTVISRQTGHSGTATGCRQRRTRARPRTRCWRRRPRTRLCRPATMGHSASARRGAAVAPGGTATGCRQRRPRARPRTRCWRLRPVRAFDTPRRRDTPRPRVGGALWLRAVPRLAAASNATTPARAALWQRDGRRPGAR
jgi:hypothetical protein